MRRRVLRLVAAGFVIGVSATWLRDTYPGLYVLVLVVCVLGTVALWVFSTRTTPEWTLEQHHQAELARTEDDSALLAELKVMFAKRACDWPELDAKSRDALEARRPCPACGHYLLFHEPVTKVCDVCHAPQG